MLWLILTLTIFAFTRSQLPPSFLRRAAVLNTIGLNAVETQAMCRLDPNYSCNGSCPASCVCQDGNLKVLLITNLQGQLPEVFASFPALVRIKIFLTSNTGSIPTSLCLLPELNNLEISDTGIGGTVPACLLLSTQLRSLSLRHNFLSGTLPPILDTPLMTLSLANNILSGTLPFIHGTNLMSLYLSGNLWSGTIPLHIFDNTGLLMLDLDNNRLSGTIPTPATPHGRLIGLAFSNNALSGTIPVLTSTRATYLLAGNQYDDQTWNAFKESGLLTNITRVDFRENRMQLASSKQGNVILFPQDIDDCLLKRYFCPENSYCSDGWSPRMSYTCSCQEGYEMSAGNCVDVNECLATKVCQAGSCVNTPGSYYCCEAGYYNPSPEVTFQNNNVSPCELCYSDYYFLNVSAPVLAQRQLLPTNTLATCFGSCLDGVKLYTRESLHPACPTISPQEKSCQYPCRNITWALEPAAQAEQLKIELLRGGYLEELLGFPAKVDLQHHSRQTWLSYTRVSLVIIECRNQCSSVSQVIEGLGVTAPWKIEDDGNGAAAGAANESLVVSMKGPVSRSYTIVIVIVVTGVALLVLVGFIFLMVQDPVKSLPEDVAATIRVPWYRRLTSWCQRSDKGSYYYFDYEGQLPVSFDHYEITKVTRIYNPVLVQNFVGAYQVQLNRQTVKLFNVLNWTKRSDRPQREFVYERYQSLAASQEWYQADQPVILPVCHGTDLITAKYICETGFASLSLLDKGWYGKGIYFSSYSKYCDVYVRSKSLPAIIVAYTLPGNIFPVIEHSDRPDNIVGKPIAGGYQSNYVVTSINGHPFTGEGTDAGSPELFDELVVGQECQILPMYIVEVKAPTVSLVTSFQKS